MITSFASVTAWAGWKIGGAFLKAQWKWIVLLIVLLLLLWGAWVIASEFAENKKLKEEKENTIASLIQQRDWAQFESYSAREALQKERVNKELIEELRQDYLQAKSDIRQDLLAELEVFEKKRKYTFDEMVKAKPGLIEPRINNASQEHYNEMASLFND